ncbi:T-cell surface antigen CD2 [Orchesella cincta]|uniref:T-cell surface antigen CD2 n=1 Tax=Orchesella cincta TaxID=48709 RepID=A0A1D2N128_ORCCI|nr:T-cell surface antigen CD2 [Orchesella cincta]
MGDDALSYIALYQRIEQLRVQVKDQETNIYIVAGVLGGVGLALLIAVIVLFYLVIRVKKQLSDAEARRVVEEEMNAQKFAAYTGEEMHRKLVAATAPAIPLSLPGAKPASDYAFNAPFVDDRVLGAGPNSASKFHR